MADTITEEQFKKVAGPHGWSVVDGMGVAHYDTGSFAVGVALVNRIGALADAANHHPDVDLRYPAVTVRLVSHDAGGLTDRDVAMAVEITHTAGELGIAPVTDDAARD